MAAVYINLESGMPTVETAMHLRSARAQRATAVKLIHSYGSSGKGGEIRAEVHRRLGTLKRSGEIREFVKADEFSLFEPSARRAIDLCPELTHDRDYTRTNHGITVVVL